MKTRERPCLVCRKPTGARVPIRRKLLMPTFEWRCSGSRLEFVTEKTDASGSTYTVWRQPLGGRSYRVPRRSRPERSVQSAAAKILIRCTVRSWIHSTSRTSSPTTRLTEQEVEQLNIGSFANRIVIEPFRGSLTLGLDATCLKLLVSVGREACRKRWSFWTLNGGEGVLVPSATRMVCRRLKLRRTDRNRQPGSPSFATSPQEEWWSSPGAPLHVPKFEGTDPRANH